MKYIIRILLALIFCRCVVLFPVQAQVIDPAAEVEQYFAGEDMTAVKDAIPPEVAELFFEAHFHAGGASVEDFD